MKTSTQYVAKCTDENTVQTREALADIPLSQKLLRAGYKPITKEQLRERFCCEQLTRKEKEKAIERLSARHGGRVKNIVGAWAGCVRYSTIFIEDSEHYPVYDVHITPYDFYVGDVLPDRCLRSIKTAKDLGVKNFGIVTCEEKKDPVIVGFVGDPWPECLSSPVFEVDFWE